MKMNFSEVDGHVLHGLLEDASGDIVLRVDENGFIVQASDNAADLGVDSSALLFMPHICDLTNRHYFERVERYVSKALNGHEQGGWVEFPVVANRDHDEKEVGPPELSQRWYTLSLRLIEHSEAEPARAIGLMRSIQQRRSLEGELNACALTDPLTGLANRHLFCASIRRRLKQGHQASLAVLSIDRLRAIFMQYGQRTVDEIQWGFARFLEAMVQDDQELAQLDEARFGVVLPETKARDAREWVDDLLKTFASLAMPSSAKAPQLTASAGVTPVEVSLDWTLRQAELGLVIAQAGGGMRVGMCGRGGAGAADWSGSQRSA